MLPKSMTSKLVRVSALMSLRGKRTHRCKQSGTALTASLLATVFFCLKLSMIERVPELNEKIK
ncbi:hypothetical protein LPA07_12290 [Lactiplantibacillus paraplantarum]|nr:hypothetical protein LPA07_12290 [Lactiplantibacillus paraplantarum]